MKPTLALRRSAVPRCGHDQNVLRKSDVRPGLSSGGTLLQSKARVKNLGVGLFDLVEKAHAPTACGETPGGVGTLFVATYPGGDPPDGGRLASQVLANVGAICEFSSPNKNSASVWQFVCRAGWGKMKRGAGVAWILARQRATQALLTATDAFSCRCRLGSRLPVSSLVVLFFGEL